MQRRWAIILSFLFIVIVFVVLNDAERQDSPVPIIPSSNVPQFQSFTREENLVSYDEEGKINYTLRANSVSIIHESRSEMDKPLITVSSELGARWYFTSDSGTILSDKSSDPDGGQRIEFSDEVEIYRFTSGRDKEVLTTDFLIYHTDTKNLETDREVRIVSNNSVITATGMLYLLNQDKMDLLNDVEVRRTNSHGDSEVIITDFLTYDRLNEIMETDLAVKIVTKACEATSIGMLYKLIQNKFNLLSNGHMRCEN